MRKAFILLALALAFYVALSAPGVSAIAGCCCDPVLHNGTLKADLADCAAGYDRAMLPINAGPDVSCDDICMATFAPPIITPPPAGVDCNSFTFKPSPTSLHVKQVKGKKQLTLTWNIVSCPAYSINVSRCEGVNCEDFRQVALIPPTVVYTDRDPALKWNTNYTYEITANYLISGQSQPAFINGNPGDIECDGHGEEQFCVSSYYYDRFTQYLQTNGYLDISPLAFLQNFAASVNGTFSEKFNRAWRCAPDGNWLTRTTDMIVCGAGQQCVADEAGAKCVTPSACGGGGTFGLFSSTPSCEQSGNAYCFFDRSRGPVDGCFACNPRMSCADYRSSGACQRDNCHAGNCEWRNVLPDLGIGACVDTRFANCLWCTQTATSGMDNADAYNEVFDRCSPKKSDALSTPNALCTYNKNARESNACDATACMDYVTQECGSPANGITLNADNSLATTSTDNCSIKVCQLMGGLGCVKNADGSAVPDCSENLPDRRACELDHFAPNTSLVPSGFIPGRMDWMGISMLDRRNGTDDAALMQGKPGYRLRVCVVSSGNACTNAAAFAETNVSALNFNDLALQGGKTVLATMAAGENTLRYYGIDRANNPEIIKETKIVACNLCQGPKVLEVAVTPGNKVEETYYTTSNIPLITVSFNEPATLTSASLVSGARVLPVTTSPPSGANYDYQFIPLGPLDDGTYTFSFTARDNNGKEMDAPGSVTIVIDTTPGTVTILPPDGAILTTPSTDISFIFAEPLTLLEATVEQEVWMTKYAVRHSVINLLPLLEQTDPLTYVASLTGLFGGRKNIRVAAQDLAGNPTIGKSSFWVDTGAFLLRLREPAWGVSSQYAFPVVVETTRVSECRYLYNLPTPPPASAFDIAAPFDSTTGVVHTIANFDKIHAGDPSAHKLHVYCKLGTNITIESFDLRVDPSPPVIQSAFALPSVIIERRLPNLDLFTTSLKVQTNEEGFCKYGLENVPFLLLNNTFSDFDEIPKTAHDVEINVTQPATTYTYYVACKNKAQLPTPTVPVQFSVDLTVPFKATSLTLPYSNSTNVTIGVETNKHSFCYVSSAPDAGGVCMGDCPYGLAHAHVIEVPSSGKYVFYVQCSTGASNEVASLTIPVTVDVTPPVMIAVNDDSNLPEEPEFSYFPDQLQAKFLAEDNETAITKFYYRVLTFFSNETILNWTQVVNMNGTPFNIAGLALVDGNKYRIEAYPVNALGLVGTPLSSNGVTIDFSKRPDVCTDGIKESEETDIDCGGKCPPCTDGKVCTGATDCASGFCNGGVCATPTCGDQVRNGNETDVDCGGQCLPCAADKACIQNADCASGSCNAGKCGAQEPCADGVLSGTETDVDCGGACPTPCGDGKNCKADTDCAQGLLCASDTCQMQRPAEFPSAEQGPAAVIVPQPAPAPSLLSIILWLFLIMVILAALGIGGYLGYQYYLEQQTPPIQPQAPVQRPAPAPQRRLRPWPAVIENLRGIARREEPPFVDRDFVSLGALAQRMKKEKVPMREDVFDRLNDLLKGRISRDRTEDVLSSIRKEPEAFALLRRISFEKLTPAEKAQMRKRIAQLKSGELTAAEIEEMLAKLRVTAQYYRTHKEELRRELEEWLSEGKK